MENSVRQRIVDAIEARFKPITVANGYKTNLGFNITVHRTTTVQEAECPTGDIRDVGEDTTVKGGEHHYALHMEFEIKFKGADAAGEIRKGIADVTKAIGINRGTTWGDLALDTAPVSNESLELDQKDRKFSSAVLSFDVLYLTEAWKPYG